jgi:AcrR family transcriptional regulator
MPAKHARNISDSTTEARIKAAARIVFHKKGFAATRTRDIAKEANLNLALISYYFKNKKNLFELIMLETLIAFNQTMGMVFNDETTSFEKKIELVTEKYIDLITAEPEIPLFMMYEIKSHGAAILEKLPSVNAIMKSSFIKQYEEAVRKGKVTEPNPLHFLMNLLGLIVLPFINSPMIKKIGSLNEKQFDKLMQDRKKLIPIWLRAMLNAK